MLLSELITELQYRVEDDSDNSRFPEDQKIDAINNAYYTLLSIVDDRSLGKFKLTKITAHLISDPDSGYKYYRFGGNSPLRIANAKANGRECKIVSKDELFSKSPHYKYGPIVAICGAYSTTYDYTIIYVAPISTTSITLWYTQEVEGILVNRQYPIREQIKPILLGIAESELWRSDNDPTRAKEAYAEAINILQAQEGK